MQLHYCKIMLLQFVLWWRVKRPAVQQEHFKGFDPCVCLLVNLKPDAQIQQWSYKKPFISCAISLMS